MKIVMAVDTMVSVELPDQLAEKFQQPDFNLDKLTTNEWYALFDLTKEAYMKNYPNYKDLEFYVNENSLNIEYGRIKDV